MALENGTYTKTTEDKEEAFLEEIELPTETPPPKYGELAFHDPSKKKSNPSDDLQYAIEDVPPWYLCALLGFQHYLTMMGATVAMPLIYTPAMCVGDDTVAQSEILSTIFFVSGMVTILQSTLGSRLPIVQGGTFAFLTPIFAILSLPQWQCPTPGGDGNNSTNISTLVTATMGYNVTTSPGDSPAGQDPIWHSRMREIQGAIIVASLFQVVIGFSGIIGLMLRYIGPLAIAPTISLIGISLFKSASTFCAKQWWIALMTIFLVMLFSQYLRNIDIPSCYITGGRCKKGGGYPVFKLFPVILAILTSWSVCGILTAAGAFPEDEGGWGYYARVDTKAGVISDAKWFRFPYPGQWGLPTVSTAGVFGMLAGILAGMIESVGDYYAAARLSGAPPPPIHAINRGIMFEGIGCVLAGLWGTGTGTTSYSENIGALGITKVGSRRVIQVGGLIMIIFGMLGKFGALFVTIPDPIIGGVFMVMFGMITAVGISNLQYVDLNSSRNLFIFGFSLFFGLSLSQWVAENAGAINTGSEIFDQIMTVLFSTSMFVGGAVGFILDNTIPGTDDERGMTEWRKHLGDSDVTGNEESKAATQRCYDLPFGMDLIRRLDFLKYIPICPTFDGSCFNKKTDTTDDIEDTEEDSTRRTDNKDHKTIVMEEPAAANSETSL